MEWVKVSEALIVLPKWENSSGTKKEIKIAKKLNIPVFYDYYELIKFFK